MSKIIVSRFILAIMILALTVPFVSNIAEPSYATNYLWDEDRQMDISQAYATGANDFICTIRASGGDYTTLTLWEAAIQSDFTAAASKVYTVSSMGTYNATDDGAGVTFTGGGTGTLKHINLTNKAYVITTAGVINTGTVTCASGRTFTISNTGSQISNSVAECYNDWLTTGLVDKVTIAGSTTSATHYIVVYAPSGQRHSGKLTTSGGNYTGFALKPTSGAIITVSNQYTILEGLIIDGMGGTYVAGVSMSYSTGNYLLIRNCIFYRTGHTSIAYVAFTGADYGYSTLYNNIFIQSAVSVSGTQNAGKYCKIYNCTIYDAYLNGGTSTSNVTDVRNTAVYYSGAANDYTNRFNLTTSTNNAGSDVTTPGSNALLNQDVATNYHFTRVTYDNNQDFHITSESDLINAGSDMSGTYTDDIDFVTRTGTFDIGADEYVAASTGFKRSFGIIIY
jgi:hypothetical protein